MPQQAQEGAQKKTHDLSFSRAAIGINNANAQQIASAIVGDHQLRDSHRSPTKEDVNGSMPFSKISSPSLHLPL